MDRGLHNKNISALLREQHILLFQLPNADHDQQCMMKLTSPLDLLLYFLHMVSGGYSATLVRKAVTTRSVLSRLAQKLETTAIIVFFILY